jgi:ribosomal protein S18 acetylase RimI-like enzyme
MKVSMQPIGRSEREEFIRMAEQHFRELNSAFEPQEDWKSQYFEAVMSKPKIFARWISLGPQRTGFMLYGVEEHRFLPRLTGMIYELYILPEFRRKGLARQAAVHAIHELEAHSPSKIQLEVLQGNKGAGALWKSLGFETISERLVLKNRMI